MNIYLMNRNRLVDTYLHVFGMDVVFCFKENFVLDDMLSKYTRNFLLMLYDFGKWLQMQTWLLKYDPHQPHCCCGFCNVQFPLACKSNLQLLLSLFDVPSSKIFSLLWYARNPFHSMHLFFTYLLHQKVTSHKKEICECFI